MKTKDLLTVQRMASSRDGRLLQPANGTLAEWFSGETLPVLAPVGTATEPDSDGEQMATIRSYAHGEDVQEAFELVDATGTFCGLVRRDSYGWLFIDPAVMFE